MPIRVPIQKLVILRYNQNVNATRQIVLEVLDQLGDDATLDEVLNRLHVRNKIEEGLGDMRAGRTHTSDEVRRRISQWPDKFARASTSPTER